MKLQTELPVVFVSIQRNNDPKAAFNEKFPKNVNVPTVARIYDKEKGTERLIQYTKGQQTIYADEMKGEPKPAPSKDPIMMRDGLLFCNPKEKMLIEYLKKSYLKGNSDLLEGNPIYELQDYKVSTEKELEKIYEDVNLIMAIKNMSADELGALSMVLGDVKADLKDASENRWNLTAEAKRNPQRVQAAMDNPKTQRKAKILLAINDNVISVNKMARLIQWSDGSKITTVPVGLDAIDYFVDMSFLEEYSEVWTAIQNKMNPTIAAEKKTFSPVIPEKNADVEFVERCLESGALAKSKMGGHFSIGGTKKGDDYYCFHQGNIASMVQYLKDHPEVKAILEEQLSVKQ